MRKHTKAWIISKLNSLRVNNTRLSGIDCFGEVIKASRMSLAVYLSSPAVVNLWHFHQKLEPLFWWLINTFTKFLKHTFSLVHFFYPVKDFAGRGLTLKKVACKSESHTLLLNSSRESKVIVLPFLSLLILCDNQSVRSFSALETSGFVLAVNTWKTFFQCPKPANQITKEAPCMLFKAFYARESLLLNACILPTQSVKIDIYITLFKWKVNRLSEVFAFIKLWRLL